MSSIFRLDLYVGIYALTYWRVAAFIWMGLVAVGLVLIIARIALGKSNGWLSPPIFWRFRQRFMPAASSTSPGIIASYNVEQSYEMMR